MRAAIPRVLLPCLASAACALAPASEVPARPNIVLIMVDDLGAEAIGCYGGSDYSTPHIDALARSGMRFEHAHSTPLCTPTRVRIMTGRGSLRSYQRFSILHPEERTFAHHLGEAGYATAVAGKWQLFGARHYGAWAGRGTLPDDAGFDAWSLWQVDELGSRYWKPHITEDGAVREDVAERYGPDVFCEYLERFMTEQRDGPFLAYFPMALTHDPFVRTPRSRAGKASKSARFADMVAYADELVGRLVAQLERLGIADETLLLFTTDNGTHPSIVSTANGAEVRGGKGLSIDAGTHVPLIAVWPGVVRPGSVCEDLVDLADVFSTIVEAGGATIPAGHVIDGRSFLPQLRGERGVPREWITCHYEPRPGNPEFPVERWARDRRFKLYEDGRLFDVVADPLEERSLQPGTVTRTAAEARARLATALAGMPERARRITR
ncbi:MAG: sulfatase-like hydrolase/transferase [Planctomycetota bacterium]|nr:sulfatase-like hydrolase/transferase [Planctomycetota bacterium]